jgi:putative transposase
MRIKAEDFEEGKYYHIYNHAVSESLLFRNDEDYIHFLKLMSKFFNHTDFSILSYCLMPNHYHFLMQQKKDIPLFIYFNKLCHEYSLYYNKKYEIKGTIFRSKLQHIMINNDAYLGYLCSYIHLNPVKAGLTSMPENWNWSNYSEWIGEKTGSIIDLMQRDLLFATAQVYKDYVNNLDKERIERKYLIDN